MKLTLNKLRRLCLGLSCLMWLLAAVSAGAATGKAEHIVVVVWDGLRPDLVTETNTPTLFQLARDGVFFQQHHAVYLSSTEVNGTALATGCYPNRSGIFANRDYRPELDPLQPTAVESLPAVRRGDELNHGNYLGMATLAEILQQAGQRTVVAGAKGVTLLHDRQSHPDTPGACVDLFEGAALPAGVSSRLVQALGPMPAGGTARDDWTTRALTGPLWQDGVPKFSLLWLSEPDLTQHRAGPGAAVALAALRGSDNHLARVLAALTARGLRDKTDILVVSDHGFSTAARTIDLAAVLARAGFNARRAFTEQPVADDIVVVGNGGSVLLYVIGHNNAVVHRLVEFLQQQDFTGVVLTQQPLPGTFTMDQVRINTPHTPDVVVALRWTADPSAVGVPGRLVADGVPPKVNVGLHGSLSRFDLHNTLIAAGPDFRTGLKSELPSGNADVAPTILQLLGVTPPAPMDGRVLSEAFRAGAAATVAPEVQRLEADRTFERVVWRQYLQISKVGEVIYFDEGNGTATPR